MPDLATIGYENATLPEVIARLKAAGVEVLIDVRAVAASRRAGFSKTLLSNGLAEAGIEYVHPTALLCLEADAAGCHRRVVAERLRDRLGVTVRDL